MNANDSFDELFKRAAAGNVSAPGAEQALAMLKNRMDVQVSRRYSLFPYVSIAAAILIAISIKYIPPGTSTHQQKNYSTAPAQRATITLSDGSTVTLAPASNILVSGRDIELTGEALFTVSHKDGSPFTVKAGNTTTKVLGTTFAIRKYFEDKTARIAVAEGRISVNNSILSNGDIAIAGDTVEIQHNSELVSTLLSFAQGNLVINGQSLAETRAQLERWLNVNIRIETGVTTKPFSTTLTTENLTEVLRELAALTNSTYTINGRSVTFHD